MSEIIELLTDWINTGTALVLGTNLFARILSDSVNDDVVLLRNITGATQDKQQRFYQDYPLQVVSRASKYITAESNSELVFAFLHENKKALHQLPDSITPEIEVKYCFAIQGPTSIGKDERGRWLFSNNYFLKIEKFP